MFALCSARSAERVPRFPRRPQNERNAFMQETWLRIFAEQIVAPRHVEPRSITAFTLCSHLLTWIGCRHCRAFMLCTLLLTVCGCRHRRLAFDLTRVIEEGDRAHAGDRLDLGEYPGPVFGADLYN